MKNFFLILFLPLVLFAEKPKVYDCFLFFNELKILEIRLHELHDHVDYFVLLEGLQTFRGKVKPLYYELNKDRFKKFQNKIIHVVLKERIQTSGPWKREAYYRNQLKLGLKNCRPEDIVMISDVDEIPRSSRLTELIAPLLSKQEIATTAKQNLHRYYLNRKCEKLWAGTVATTHETLKKTTAQELRKSRGKFFAIGDCGWHFTSMGGVHRVMQKLSSYSHAKHDSPKYKNPEKILRDARHHPLYPLGPIDDSYPIFVQKNQDYLKQQGLLFFL